MREDYLKMVPAWLSAMTIGEIVGGLVGLTFITVIIVGGFKLVKSIHPIIRAVVDFLDDMRGRPERPGYDAEPGFLERLRIVEVKLENVLELLKEKVNND